MPPRAPLQLGSQLFINRHDSPETVARWVALMAESGLRLVRLFLTWDQLEPQPGVWQWARYDAAFAAAHAHGLRVIGTLMSMSPPGWMRRTDGAQDIGELEDAALVAAGECYIQSVVTRWKDAPALDSWILWNEPRRTMPRTAATAQRYREFLSSRYGAIARFNTDSFRQFARFEEIEAPAPVGHGFVSRRDQIDWMRFSTADLTGHLRRIARCVKALDPDHPVHVNPDRISQCRLDYGQSIWAQAGTVDFLGCSAHPVWHSTRFPRERWTRTIALFADLTRSATPDAGELFWVTELQGGASVFSGLMAGAPSAGELRHWIWESLGSGARAVVFWCFNWRLDGYEAGEWALMGQDRQPTERLREVATIAAFLHQHGELLNRSKPAAPDVAILVSESSQLLALVDGVGDDPREGRNRQMAADAIAGAYLLASDLGREVQFVDERRLRERGCEASVRTLLVPGCCALEPGTLAAIGRFVRAGGTVVADHLLAWKTPDGAIAEDQVQPLQEVFGGALHDILPIAPTSPQPQSPAGTGISPDAAPDFLEPWFVKLTFAPGPDGQVTHQWADGSAAAVSRRHGSGQAVRLGTVFFQPYVFAADESRRQLLQQLIPEPAHAVTLAHRASTLRLRRLRAPDGDLAILLNSGDAMAAELVFHRDGALQELGGAARVVAARDTISFPLEAWGVRVFHFMAGPNGTSPLGER